MLSNIVVHCTMIKQYTLAVLCIISITLTQAQHKNVTLIQNVLAKQQAAWNSGNIDDFMQGYWYSDSLLFVGKSGLTYGWNNTLSNYKKNYASKDAMGTLAFNLLKIQAIDARHYMVVGKWQLTRTIGDIGGHFTLLFKKIKGKWVIVADHSS